MTEGRKKSETTEAPPWTEGKLGVMCKEKQHSGKTLSTSKKNKQEELRMAAWVLGEKCDILIDSGSTGNFISSEFVERHQLQDRCITVHPPLVIRLANGAKVESRLMLPRVKWRQCRGTLQGEMDLPLLPLVDHEVILGMPWLKDENPLICWQSGEIEERFGPVNSHHLGSVKELVTKTDVDDTGTYHRFLEALLTVPESLVGILKQFQTVFPDRLPCVLPMERPIQHHIKLLPGAEAPNRKQYKLSAADMKELEKQCQEALVSGKIRRSTSPFNAPSLMVKKVDGGNRWCNDYRALNAITEKDRIVMPNMDSLFEHLAGARYFSKLDLMQGFNQIRIAPEDVAKTAFSTPSGHYEWLVLPFGLCNAPATFQALMQKVLEEKLYGSVIVFIDDILIYSKTEEDHMNDIKWVLQKLRDWQLFASIKKCAWLQQEVDFLGHRVSRDGLAVMKEKVQAIVEWPPLVNIKDVRSFLGLAGYYRKFVQGFSQLALPLTNLTQSGVTFRWGKEEEDAFNALKTALTNAPILMRPNLSKSFQVTTDASGFAVGAILSQEDENALQRPIAFLSRKMSAAERRYAVHEQELLAVVTALKEWRHLLHGQIGVVVITDHMSLRYLNSQPFLSNRQARWVEFLQQFDLVIKFRAGKENEAADALSRRGDHQRAAEAEEAEVRKSAASTPHLQYRLAPLIVSSSTTSDLLDEIRTATAQDESLQLILRNPADHGFILTDGILRNQQSNVVVPSDRKLRARILYEAHDAPTGGHRGLEKTLDQVMKSFWWSGIRAEIQDYVSSCVSCQSNKASNQKPAGLLHPLPIPNRRWEQVSMDFIGPLPVTRRGNDFVLTVVDKLSKMVHILPCRKTITAKQVASLFWREVVRLHGMPSSIVSDRDTRFISSFWGELWRLLGTKLAMSTAHHPQTDGQTERTNRVIEEVLRAYINDVGDDWDEHITAAEITINNSKHSSSQFSPFYLNYGQHPVFPLQQATRQLHSSDNPAAAECIRQLHQDLDKARVNLEKAQARQAHYADMRRRPADDFQIGDRVMLNTGNLLRWGNKLTSKFIGPFEVMAVLPDKVVELKLPHEMRLRHPRFNISRVKRFKVAVREFPDRQQLDRPPPEIVDGAEEYEVESILAKEEVKLGRSHVTRYLVKWKGYDMSEATWEKAENLTHAQEALQSFLGQQETEECRDD